MLRNAGVAFRTMPPNVDESSLKQRIAELSELARSLAEAKALGVSALEPDHWVIGSDSTVIVDGRLFDKPANRTQAAEHLRFFSGRLMRLTSAAALARAGKIDWAHAQSAELQVRPLSDGFIEAYLTQEWPEVSYCVGVFRLEGPGIQLFERIDGDYFTVLGMPLLPLLGALRERAVLAS